MRAKIVIGAALRAIRLKRLRKLRQQGEVRKLRGRLAWEGDLDAQRTDGG